MRMVGKNGNNLFIVTNLHTRTVHEHEMKIWVIPSEDSNNSTRTVLHCQIG